MRRRAAARIRLIELYETAPEPETKPAQAPRIVLSIERDRFGRRQVVVRCDGWAI